MVEKKYFKHILITSLLFTIFVFIGGVILGWSLNNFRENSFLDNLQNNELDTDSYLIEQDLLSGLPISERCELSGIRSSVLSGELRELGKLLTVYEEEDILDKSTYDYLKRKYFLLEIKTYNILRKLKGDCNLDYDLILFFYDLSDTDSKRQGYVLDALSENKTYDFRIFSLDRSFSEDPLLEVVKKYYNITTSPTLVINENKTDGFTPIDEIINKL